MRQWLNSSQPGAKWWSPTNIFDRSTSSVSKAGRLNTLNSGFVNVLALPAIEYRTNSVFEYGDFDGGNFATGQKIYTLYDKIFIPSHTELNLSQSWSGNTLGTVMDYYVGQSASGDAYFVKTGKSGSAEYYWLRSCYPGYADNQCGVNSSGSFNNNNANNTNIGVSADNYRKFSIYSEIARSSTITVMWKAVQSF